MDWHEALVVTALLFPFGFAIAWTVHRRRQREAAQIAHWLRRIGAIEPSRRALPANALIARVGEFVRLKLGQAGLSPGEGRRLALVTGVLLLLALALLVAPLSLGSNTPLLALALALAPGGYLGYRLVARRARFAAQFPDALEAMVRALQAGHTVDQALRLLADEYPPPIADEFRQINNHLQMGVPLRDALREFQSRLDLPEVQYFVTTLIVQRESGGQLAAILAELARLMRRRRLFQGKLRALTAEARFTAWFIGGAPLAYIGYRYLFAPESLRFFLEDPTGKGLFKVALVLIACGILVLRRMMQLRF